jgi:hypothetical protein
VSEPEPLAVYDVSESWTELSDQQMAVIRNWLRMQGIEPNDTYRFEIWRTDRLFARVFQYDRDEHGKPYCPLDHEHVFGKVFGPGEEPSEQEWCDIARREPFDVPLSSMPPVEPLPVDRSVT